MVSCRKTDYRSHAESKTGQAPDQPNFPAPQQYLTTEDSKPQSAIAGILGYFRRPASPFFSCSNVGTAPGHELHDDRCRDIWHDPQCKYGKTRKRPTRKHIEQIQYALLTAEQLLELGRIDTRHGNMRPNAVYDQRQQQKNQTTTQIAVLAGFAIDAALVATSAFLIEASGHRTAGGFDRNLGSRCRTDTAQLDRRTDCSSVDHLYNLGILSDQTGLLQSKHVNLCQTQLGQSRQRDFSIELQRLRLETTLGRRRCSGI